MPYHKILREQPRAVEKHALLEFSYKNCRSKQTLGCEKHDEVKDFEDELLIEEWTLSDYSQVTTL